MKFLEIFRFEIAYQTRRISTWLSFVALGAVAFMFIRGNFLADALYDDFYVNSPYVIAVVTVFGCMFWLLVAAAVTGEVTARDTETGMHPLSYTTPVSKTQYLGGRFLAAFTIHAVIMLAVPIGVILSVYGPGVDAAVIGPFRPEAYLSAYGLIALPNAFIGTAVQFAFAALGRRPLAAYLGSALLFITVYGGIFLVFYFGGRKEHAALLDAFTQLTVFDITERWTSVEKSSRMIRMEGSLLYSRIVWISIALGTLLLTYVRFRFAHHVSAPWWSVFRRQGAVNVPASPEGLTPRDMIPAFGAGRSFGLAACTQQTLVIAKASFLRIAKSKAGLPLLAIIAALTILIVPEHMNNLGTPLLPGTGHILTFLIAPLAYLLTPWLIIPLIIVLWAGMVVWRERDSWLGDITDAAPVPDRVLFLGRLIGLSLMLLAWLAMLTAAGMLVQVRMGYYAFEPFLYFKTIFGLQFAEYLIFTVLVLVIQGLVAQKFLGHMLALMAYLAIIFAEYLGLKHHLLVYGSGPGWTHNDIRGYGASLGPWAWFKAYWGAWALLLAIAAGLFWVRGIDRRPAIRIRLARQRFTRSTAFAAAAAAGLVLILGSFIFYNTNVLNEYTGAGGWLKRRAEYEQRYVRFRNVPQPVVTGTKLQIEIYPSRQEAEIRGAYRLMNTTGTAIDSIHLATIRSMRTGAVSFDRAASLVIDDDDHGHRTYALTEPLKPGDSLELRFKVHYKPKGFTNTGTDGYVVSNGTYFTDRGWLPLVGYQEDRDLVKPGERRSQGLPARTLIPTLADAAEDVTGESEHDGESKRRISFEATIGTEAGQVAIAPGALQRTWTKRGRRYFYYATGFPIGNCAFFSARYALHRERFNGIDIQLYHHPGHTANLDRILRSVRASLAYYSREFGRYPYGYIRLVENPVRMLGAHADAASIDFGHGFSLFNPADDPQGLDFPFAVIAHEVAHQWWGAQLPYARAEGAGLLTESPAWYSAMGVIEETYGREHLRKLLRFFRQPYPIPPIRQSVPLLQGRDQYAFYRKGPFALFALSEYMGKDKVNGAYRRLIEKHNAGMLPAATSLDLYSELQSVTPDSLRYLLHDLFAANTFWQLVTTKAESVRKGDSLWEVTLRVKARKITVNPAGAEKEVPMDEWIEVGIFALTREGRDFGRPLYMRKHLIRSGEQTITVSVPGNPADAGIDPYHLLIDLEPYDNVDKVKNRNQGSDL